MNEAPDEANDPTDIAGIDEDRASALRRAGYRTVAALRAASEDELAAVEGVSRPLAAHVKTDVGDDTEDEEGDAPDAGDDTGDGGRGTADDWTHPDSTLREPRRSAAGASVESPYFEETLTPQLPGGVLALVDIGTAAVALPLGVLILVMAPASALEPVLVGPVLGFASIGAVFGAGVYRSWRVHVAVTDDGVEVVRNWNAFRGAPEVTVPFETVAQVRYGGTADDPLRVPRRDREIPEHTYMLWSGRLPGLDASYPGGVRIDRRGDTPVYIGSGRPAELAAAVDARTGSDPVSTATDEEAAVEPESESVSDASGEVPGASKEQERRGVVFVVIFAVGMIVAIEGFGSLGVVAVLGVLGALLFVGGVNAWRTERHELDTFRRTTGTVLATEAASATEGRRKPLVRYGYTVDGETHRNDKIWPGKPMAKRMSPRRGREFLSRFPEGEETTVYYDPENPSNAFIVRERTTGWLALIVVVGAGLLGVVALVLLGAMEPPSP